MPRNTTKRGAAIICFPSNFSVHIPVRHGEDAGRRRAAEGVGCARSGCGYLAGVMGQLAGFNPYFVKRPPLLSSGRLKQSCHANLRIVSQNKFFIAVFVTRVLSARRNRIDFRDFSPLRKANINCKICPGADRRSSESMVFEKDSHSVLGGQQVGRACCRPAAETNPEMVSSCTIALVKKHTRVWSPDFVSNCRGVVLLPRQSCIPFLATF